MSFEQPGIGHRNGPADDTGMTGCWTLCERFARPRQPQLGVPENIRKIGMYLIYR
jgi:hypothetical protein